ncbi:MAG: NADP-dependent malic enzyme [Gammaproteobacteria bacterium]|nr:MAG: NADP-dependent malic enzyme [Gammaproteobacteria bacterium]
MKSDDQNKQALDYHRQDPPGKISVTPTKPLANQQDLALAYTPGVAAVCEAINDDPMEAFSLTAKGNLVAVITNGTAVLGLGAIGPLAAKPVMEGKGVLFKKFAGIDVFDIEINERDTDRLVDIIAALEPTFGGINLEDIRAPECFELEAKLKVRMNIPVFHDDQHGTAIIVAAALKNAFELTGRSLNEIRLVTSGAGAAALSCLNLLVVLGLPIENIIITDKDGVVYEGRGGDIDPYMARYVTKAKARSLKDALAGADVLLGLSAAGVVKKDMIEGMAPKPIIFALANPTPEIMPEEVQAVRPDAIIATGRSDYPNQVNNVLCFPYIFRGALDVGATEVNDAMMIACVNALAALAHIHTPDVVLAAYKGKALVFGPDYLIPKPFDPRLTSLVATAVAKAAMDSGVATRPVKDFAAYRERLTQLVFRSGLLMKSFFDRAREKPVRLVFSEGEDVQALRAVQQIVDEGIARPILIGREEKILAKLKSLGLRFNTDDAQIVDPQTDQRRIHYTEIYHRMVERKGITPETAQRLMLTHGTVWALTMLHEHDADAVICGNSGRPEGHLEHARDIIGYREGVRYLGAMNVLILSKGVFFFAHAVTPDPTAEEVAETALLAAEMVRRFGIEPKAALLSQSNFGSSQVPSAERMRKALALIQAKSPDLEIEGEMQADAALNEEIRARLFPDSKLKGSANLFIMPSRDASNISLNLTRILGDGVAVGPVILGLRKSVHLMAPAATVRRIVNISAIASVDAQIIGDRMLNN